MKNRVLRIIAFVVAVGLIVTLGSFANSLVGNPISNLLAKKSAEKYIAETYPASDYTIEETGYSFKDGNYYVHVVSPSSMDTKFSISINWMGKVVYDWYETVESKMVTAQRLDSDYRNLCDSIFSSALFPYPSDLVFGTLNYGDRESMEYIAKNEQNIYRKNYLTTEDLVLDGIYDVGELGNTYGSLCLYVDTENCTEQMAAEVLLQTKKLFDQAGVGFHDIDLTLQHPRDEDGNRSGESFHMLSFLYEDIQEDGLIEKVQQIHTDIENYFHQMDNMKSEELGKAVEE